MLDTSAAAAFETLARGMRDRFPGVSYKHDPMGRVHTFRVPCAVGGDEHVVVTDELTLRRGPPGAVVDRIYDGLGNHDECRIVLGPAGKPPRREPDGECFRLGVYR